MVGRSCPRTSGPAGTASDGSRGQRAPRPGSRGGNCRGRSWSTVWVAKSRTRLRGPVLAARLAATQSFGKQDVGVFQLPSRGVGAERIDVACTRPRDVLYVPGHDDEVPFQCRGGDQSIHGWNWIARADASPTFGNRPIDFNDAVPEFSHRSPQPRFERDRGRRVPPSNSFDSSSKFAQRQDAQEQLLRLALPEPVDNKRICTFAFSKFGQHVGVDEIAHGSIRRNPEESRSKSASSPTSGMASRCSTNGSDDPAESDLSTCSIPFSDNVQVPRGESSRR